MLDNKCAASSPQFEVGIIEGGTKNTFLNSIKYYDDKIYTEQRIHYLNPLPSSDFKVYARMKKTVQSADNVTAEGYVTLPELRIDTPLELGCFVKPENVSSSHSGVSNLTQEGEVSTLLIRRVKGLVFSLYLALS